MATTSEAPPSEPCDVPHGLQAGTVYGTLEDLGAEVKRLAPNSTLPASRQMKPMTSKEATSYANAHPQLARPAHGRFYCRYGQDKKRGPGFYPGNKSTFSVPFTWQVGVGWSVLPTCQRCGFDCPLSVGHSHQEAVATFLATGEI